MKLHVVLPRLAPRCCLYCGARIRGRRDKLFCSRYHKERLNRTAKRIAKRLTP